MYVVVIIIIHYPVYIRLLTKTKLSTHESNCMVINLTEIVLPGRTVTFQEQYSTYEWGESKSLLVELLKLITPVGPRNSPPHSIISHTKYEF